MVLEPQDILTKKLNWKKIDRDAGSVLYLDTSNGYTGKNSLSHILNICALYYMYVYLKNGDIKLSC